MREKIYKYLLEEQDSITANQILEKFFFVSDKPISQAEKIVDSILMSDARFVKEKNGHWTVAEEKDNQYLNEIVFSIIEFETLPLNHQKELPILLGLALIKNYQPNFKKIYTIDLPIKITESIQEKRKAVIAENRIDGNFISNLDLICERFTGSILIDNSPHKTMERINWFLRRNGNFELETEKINLKHLSKKLLSDCKFKTTEDVADALNISFNSPLNFSDRIDLISDILIEILHKLDRIRIESLEDLNAYLSDTIEWVNFSDYNFDQNDIKELPASPGVYLMKNRNGEIFYVGKSKNLRTRVESYFVNRFDLDEKGKKILNEIYDLNIEVAGSELEALLLENKYINLYQPVLNRQLKIHNINEQKYHKRRVIAFLPSEQENTINLFLINGASARQISFIIKKSDFFELKSIVKQFFFDKTNCTSSFSSDQMGIIWRWIELHKNQINFFNIDDFGTLVRCMEIIENYINDPKLMTDKINYH